MGVRWAPRLTAGSLSWTGLADLNAGVINGTAEVKDPVERDLALVWETNGSVTADQELLWQVDAAAVEFLNGSLTISGQTINTVLREEIFLAIDSAGALTATGQTVNTGLTLNLFVSIEPGSLSLTGISADTQLGNNLGLDLDVPGSLSVSGQTVNTDLSLDLFASIEPGSLTILGRSIETNLTETIPTVDRDFSLIWQRGGSVLSSLDLAWDLSVDGWSPEMTDQSSWTGQSVSSSTWTQVEVPQSTWT